MNFTTIGYGGCDPIRGKIRERCIILRVGYSREIVFATNHGIISLA